MATNDFPRPPPLPSVALGRLVYQRFHRHLRLIRSHPLHSRSHQAFHCTCTRANLLGIYVNTKGRGLIEGNEISDNEFNGIAIKFEGHPKKVCNNRIFGNKQRGIYVSGDSTADIGYNDVFGNAAGDVVEE